MAAPPPMFSSKTLASLRAAEALSLSSSDDSSDLSSSDDDEDSRLHLAIPPADVVVSHPPPPLTTPSPSPSPTPPAAVVPYFQPPSPSPSPTPPAAVVPYFRPPPPLPSQALVSRRTQYRDDAEDDHTRFIPMGKHARAQRFGDGGTKVEKAMVFWRYAADNRKEFHRICNFYLPMTTPMVVKSRRLVPKYDEIDARNMVTTCRVYDPYTPAEQFDPKTIDETTLETWFLAKSDDTLVLYPIITQWAVNLRKEIAARKTDARIRASLRKEIADFPSPNDCRSSNNIDDRRTIKFGGIRCLSPMSLYRQNEERRLSRRPASKRRRDEGDEDEPPVGGGREDEGDDGGEDEEEATQSAQEEGAQRGRPRSRSDLCESLSNMEARLTTTVRESHEDIMSKLLELMALKGSSHTPSAVADRWCVLVKRFVESRGMTHSKIREWRARMDSYAMSKDPQETLKRIQKTEGVEGALASALYAMAVFCATNPQAQAQLDALERA